MKDVNIKENVGMIAGVEMQVVMVALIKARSVQCINKGYSRQKNKNIFMGVRSMLLSKVRCMLLSIFSTSAKEIKYFIHGRDTMS